MIDPKEALEMSKTLLCTKAGQVAHQLSAKKKGRPSAGGSHMSGV